MSKIRLNLKRPFGTTCRVAVYHRGRRIVLGRKARIWYAAMIDNSPNKRIERKLWRLRMSFSRFSKEWKATIEEFRHDR